MLLIGLTAKRLARHSVAISLLVAASSAWGQDQPTLAAESPERIANAKGLTFIWKVKEDVHLRDYQAPGTPTNGELRLSMKGGSYSVSYDVKVSRSKDLTIVNGSFGSYNEGKRTLVPVKYASLYGPDWFGGIAYKYIDKQDKPSSATFGLTTSSSLSRVNPASADNGLWPQDLVFLAGTSLVDLYGLRATLTNDNVTSSVYLAQNYKGGVNTTPQLQNPWTFRLTLDKAHSFLADVVGMEGENERYHAKVIKWTKREDDWYPAQFEVTTVTGSAKNPLSRTVRTYQLKAVQRSLPQLKIPLPKNAPILDFRLEAPDLGYNGFPPPDAIPVQYRWANHLPTIAELRGLKPADKPKATTNALRYLPPVLLAIAALIIYSRSRRPK